MTDKALFALGAFRFLAGRSMFERLTRSESFLWAEQERLGGTSTLSYMGRRAREVEVTGETYAERASTDDPLKAASSGRLGGAVSWQLGGGLAKRGAVELSR
jgi:phage protein U